MFEVITIDNFLSKSECDELIQKYKNELTLLPAEVSDYDPNRKFRKSKVGFIDTLGDLDKKITDVLTNNIKVPKHDVSKLGPYQFTEYNEGDFFDWHTDANKNVYSDRFASVVIQLNDEYEGGDLELKDNKGNKIEINQKVGKLYVFPSTMKHRVSEVIKGVRYSLVNWVKLNKQNYKQELL
jgi:predicted 2-oxoglutarate/Fe(II)-dependent dioxygenase YbiX